MYRRGTKIYLHQPLGYQELIILAGLLWLTHFFSCPILLSSLPLRGALLYHSSCRLGLYTIIPGTLQKIKSWYCYKLQCRCCSEQRAYLFGLRFYLSLSRISRNSFLTPWFCCCESLPTILRRFHVKLNCKLFFALEKIPENGQFRTTFCWSSHPLSH